MNQFHESKSSWHVCIKEKYSMYVYAMIFSVLIWLYLVFLRNYSFFLIHQASTHSDVQTISQCFFSCKRIFQNKLTEAFSLMNIYWNDLIWLIFSFQFDFALNYIIITNSHRLNSLQMNIKVFYLLLYYIISCLCHCIWID